MGVSENSGYLMRILLFKGTILGSPIFGNSHVHSKPSLEGTEEVVTITIITLLYQGVRLKRVRSDVGGQALPS